jgi:hypothetical protein
MLADLTLLDITSQTQIDIGNGRFASINAVDANGQNKYSQAPPWVEMPADGMPFEDFGTLNITPADIGVEQLLLRKVMDNGYDGVIKKYSVNFGGGGFVDGSGTLLWRFKINGAVVNNYINIANERGSKETPKELTGGLRLYSGQVFEIYVIHVSDVAITGLTTATIEGFQYDNQGY